MKKTLKQIADELGIDKQRVYRYVKSEKIAETIQNGQTMLYSEAAQAKIKSHFEEIDSGSSEAYRSEKYRFDSPRKANKALLIRQDAVIDTLQNQIKLMDAQLADKSKEIEQLLEALTNAQKLQGIAEQKIKAIEDKNKIFEDLQNENERLKAELEAAQGHWWNKLLRKTS